MSKPINLKILIRDLHKAVKEELSSRKGLGWDEIDSVTGCDGLEKEVDDALKNVIKDVLVKHL